MARSRRLEVVISGDAKGALASMGAVERRAGGLGGSFKAVGAAAVAGFAVVGAAAVGAGAALYGIGSSFDSAYDTIRVRTGQTGEALGGLQQSFRNVVRTVPADFGAASEAIAGINQRLGLTGQPLEAVSRRMLELSRLTETDLSANVANLTRVFGDWGIEASQLPGTMDQLFRATQQSGVGLDQLSSQVVQFGAPLRNLGFSFSDSVAMLSQFEAQGVNTTTVMSGLRQGLRNFAAAGEEPADAFRRFVAGVQGGTLTMTDAMATFGARAGADMFAAISEGRFDFDALSASIAGGSDTIMAASRDTRDFGEQWQIIKNRVMLALEPVATRVFTAVGDAMGRLGPIAGRVGAWLAETLPPVMAQIEAKVREVWPRVLDAFRAVEAWVREHWPEISATVSEVMDTVSTVISGVVDTVMVIWDNFGNNFLEHGRRIFHPLIQVVTGALDIVKGVIGGFTALIQGDWSGAWEAMKQAWSGLWNVVLGVLKLVWEEIRSVLGIALEIVGSMIKGALRPVGRFFASIWRAMSAAVTAAWRLIRTSTVNAINAVRSVVGTVLRAIRNTWSTAWGAVRATAQSVWRGIRTAVSGGMDFIKGAIRGGVSAVKRIWAGLKRAFEVPINWVLDRVINPFLGVLRTVADAVNLGGIIPGDVALLGSGATSFHAGGVVGSEGGQPHRGPMRPGEVPAVLQTGERVISRSGRIAGRLPRPEDVFGPNNMPDDATLRALGWPVGGLPNPFSAAAGVAQDAVSFATDTFRDLAAGGLEQLLGPIRDAISDAGDRFGLPGEVFAGLVNKPIDALLMWVAGTANELQARDVPTSFGPGNIITDLWNVVRGQFPSATLISGYRPGAITATGNPSLHGRGRAIDITPDMGIFNWLAATYPNSGELIFSPAGGRQIYRGRPHMYSEPTRGDHWDHIHWGWFDRGGYLKPGWNMAYNGTGTPEPVGHHLNGGRADTALKVEVHVHGSVLAEGDLVAALEGALRKGYRGGELERLIRRIAN